MRDLIESILTQPTAPFRESWVKQAFYSRCAQAKLPLFEDEMGNLWVNARNAKEARGASLIFVAHMDHPGITIQKFSRRGRKIFAHGTWLGGGPMDIRSFPVQVFSDVNALMVFDGVVRKHTKGPRGPKEVEIEILASKISTHELAEAACTLQGFKALGPWGACLWYNNAGIPKGVTKRGSKWVTKAADDLIGACAMIEGLKRAGRPRGTVALLTRAEESGFHGTLYILRKRWLNPKKSVIVSIETSSQLPGAVLGGGPVVRLGDRATVFDPAVVFWIQAQAAALAKKDKSFKYQRRVMDGGTCEATAFNCFGFHVGGISTPLENYHNMSKSGRPLPEAVDAGDVEKLAKLIAQLIANHKASHLRDLTKASFGTYTKGLLDHNTDQMRRYMR